MARLTNEKITSTDIKIALSEKHRGKDIEEFLDNIEKGGHEHE